MSVVIALALAAWVLADLALLYALAGVAFGEQPPGNRILVALILLSIGAAGNAFALDQLGRHVGL